MTIEELKSGEHLLFECISGSHAYGLQHAASDIDKKGVFVLPKNSFFGLNPVDQVNDENNDEVYFEIGKFIQLLYKNNPTCLELLNSPEETFLYKHPALELIKIEDFLSKKCKDTFAGFAYAQIKKAKGLNKKIVNPVDKKKKSILDFCYVTYQQGSQPLLYFLESNQLKQENCGLVNIANMKGMFALFHNPKAGYNGIMKKEDSLDVCLSSIPKGESTIATLYFNQDGYSAYCKEYKEYWSWVAKRNESRYQNTLEHGKNYDAKNMMHTFRLLHMAEEIARSGNFAVKRDQDRDFLWQIRMGEFEYKDLVQQAERKIKEIHQLFQTAPLPDAPSEKLANRTLINIRNEFYK